MRGLWMLAVAALLGACSTVPANSRGWIEPVDAVRAANEDPGNGVRGEFIVTVRATGAELGRVFLNSEADYRDQRNLTVNLSAVIVPELEQRLGVPLADLRNRRLVVRGIARRVRIDFISEGRPSGKYYYQTHVRVDDARQIRFAE